MKDIGLPVMPFLWWVFFFYILFSTFYSLVWRVLHSIFLIFIAMIYCLSYPGFFHSRSGLIGCCLLCSAHSRPILIGCCLLHSAHSRSRLIGCYRLSFAHSRPRLIGCYRLSFACSRPSHIDCYRLSFAHLGPRFIGYYMLYCDVQSQDSWPANHCFLPLVIRLNCLFSIVFLLFIIRNHHLPYSVFCFLYLVLTACHIAVSWHFRSGNIACHTPLFHFLIVGYFAAFVSYPYFFVRYISSSSSFSTQLSAPFLPLWD